MKPVVLLALGSFHGEDIRAGQINFPFSEQFSDSSVHSRWQIPQSSCVKHHSWSVTIFQTKPQIIRPWPGEWFPERFSIVDSLVWLMGGISGKVHFRGKPCGLQLWSSELWMCCCTVCKATQSLLPSISAVTHGKHDFDTQSLLVALYDVLGPPRFHRSPRILSLRVSQTLQVVFISLIYGIFKWKVLKLQSWYPHLRKCFFHSDSPSHLGPVLLLELYQDCVKSNC